MRLAWIDSRDLENSYPKLEEASMGDRADLSKYPGYWHGSAKAEIDNKEVRIRRLEEKLAWLEQEYTELTKRLVEKGV